MKIKDPEAPEFHSTIWYQLGYHSTNISKFVDYHPQSIAKNIPSYVQDSNDFPKSIPQNSLQLTVC